LKKGIIASLAFVLGFGLLLAGCGSKSSGGGGDKSNYKTKLTMGTGGTGGVYYPLGGEMATIFNKNIKVDGFNVSSVESGASVENIAKMGDKYQLGIAQNTTAFDAIDGKADFEGHKTNNFGVIASLYPELLQVVVMKSSGIESIADLKGKKIAVGPPGGGTRQAAELVLKAYGINKGDYKAYKEDFSDAKEKLQNGTIDASISVVGIPSSATSDLQASTHDVKFLSLNDKAVKEFTDNTAYVPYTQKAGTYEWQKEDVKTVTAMALLLASKDQVSEDLGYKITKTLFEHKDDMSIAQAKLITKDSALKGAKGLPIHPGAEKYYKEIGVMK
jgi:hypothetical protein